MIKLEIRAAWLPLLAFIVLATGCSDSPTGTTPPVPPEQQEPTVSFTYSGARSGSYRVEGDVPLDAERRPQFGTWAAALQIPGEAVGVTAARARTAPVADVFLIALHNITAPGSYTITPQAQCRLTTTTSCATGVFVFGFDWEDANRDPDAAYYIESGTVTVTAIDDEWISGTFEASGPSLFVNGGTISLASGSFDVPVVRNAAAIRSNISVPYDLLRNLLQRE